MQTQLSPEYQQRADGRAAEAILRKCVHCGFCTATCPTYQLLGDELDGPRGGGRGRRHHSDRASGDE
jgi:glycolate oxidase iron-sulfur subunit